MSTKHKSADKDNDKPISHIAEAPRYGCALAGVFEAVIGLKKSVPILHSGSGCGMSQVHGTGFAGGYNTTGDYGSTNTPCSSLVEEHVIFGGEQKLRDLIDSSLQMFKADFFAVISGCVPQLIGDDVDEVVNEFRDRAHLIHVNAPGFVGNSFDGYELFFEAVIDQLLTSKPKKENLVNIFGVVPFQHIFWKGDLRVIKNLLKDIGIEANIIFSEHDGGLANLEKISEASYNIVLSPWIGDKTVKKLEEKFDTPFIKFDGVPIGPIQTTNFLKTVGEKLNLDSKKIKEYTDYKEVDAYNTMEYSADAVIVLNPNSYFAVVADTNTAISLTKFLTEEVSFLPEIIQITDEPPLELKKDIVKAFKTDVIGFTPDIIFEKDTYKIKKNLEGRAFTILYGSSIEKNTADQFLALHHTITFPAFNRLVLNDSYAGYEGGSHLIENTKSIAIGPL
jgi:nitrogenase molybdenum-iron protein beta chain